MSWADGFHALPHISMGLRAVDPDFDLTAEYMGSLMMIVALMLALGFAILVLLALYLCVVVSFAPPNPWPSNAFRLLVLATAATLVGVCWHAFGAETQWERGLADFLAALSTVEAAAAQAHDAAADAALRAAALNSSGAAAAAACDACLPPPPPPAAANVTPPNATNTSVCDALGAAAAAAAAATTALEGLTAPAAAEVGRIGGVVGSTTGWHGVTVGAVALALFSLAAAIAVGTLSGRRSLLVLAEFVAVIVWWMMCAVVSVELAIATSLADACVDPLNTTLRVLHTLGGRDELYNATGHYLDDCDAYPSPLAAAVADVATGVADLDAALPRLPPHCSLPVPAAALSAQGAALVTAAAAVLPPLGACGGNGTIGAAFGAGVGVGLCGADGAGDGIGGVFLWQAASALVLVTLSLMLPNLWHSHFFPPLNPRHRFFGNAFRRRRRVRVEGLGPGDGGGGDGEPGDGGDDGGREAPTQPLLAAHAHGRTLVDAARGRQLASEGWGDWGLTTAEEGAEPDGGGSGGDDDESGGEAPEEPAADAGAPAADAGARSHTSSPPLGSSAAEPPLPRQLSVHDAL